MFLTRRPEEPVDEPLRDFYERLLPAAASVRRGDWRPLTPAGPPDDHTRHHLLAWTWTHAEARHLVVVNHSDRPAGARLPLPWEDLRGRVCRATDLLTGAVYDRDGDELTDSGLFVSLAAWGCHVLQW